MTRTNRLETETHVILFATDWKSKKTRVYSNAEDSEVLDQFGLEHPGYGSQRGDGSEQDKAWKKYNRAEGRIMRAKIEKVLAEIGVTGKFYFSRYAGCPCPCSAGFIFDRELRLADENGEIRRVEAIWTKDTKPEPVAELEVPKGAAAIKSAIAALAA